VFFEYRYRSPRFWWSLRNYIVVAADPLKLRRAGSTPRPLKHTQISNSSRVEFSLHSSIFSLSSFLPLSLLIPSNLPYPAERFLIAGA